MLGMAHTLAMLGFDHAILGVRDLARTEADFSKLGFTVTTRPDVGATDTENRLICFADGSYIEIFSFRDPAQPSTHRWAPLLAKGDGWTDYSLRVADIAAEVARLAPSGLPTYDPRTGGRALEDGRRWGVTVLLTGRGAGNVVLPFMIQDTEPHEVRVPRGAATVQPRGVTGIAGITLLTAALAPVEAQLAAVLGPATTASGPVRRYDIAGRWLEVVEPSGGELTEHLQARGEGVYEVTLGRPGQTRPGEGELLPVATTHGGRLRIAA
jgi:catechol 2,3-dioxygenase-like lactoylglutathione lyase family enzyme